MEAKNDIKFSKAKIIDGRKKEVSNSMKTLNQGQ